MDFSLLKNFKVGACVLVGVFLLVLVLGIFLPKSLGKTAPIQYEVQKGEGYKEIGIALERRGIITNHGFFWLYAIASGSYGKLQAGSYEVSPSMSVFNITRKMAAGDVMKNNITIIEGWNLKDIGQYLESKQMFSAKDFTAAAVVGDYATQFTFLKDRPLPAGRQGKNASLEGYIFPDTYELPLIITPEALVRLSLTNFDKKLTPDLRAEITKQKKSIFQIITMASMLEKEVQTFTDKKIVAGILWKRIVAGMPLQVDATINYATGKNDTSAGIDTKLNSLYNTYKYYGLPPGPICNPGLDSILATIYPTKSDYWYYLSDPQTQKTIFSKTLEEHNAAAARHLKNLTYHTLSLSIKKI